MDALKADLFQRSIKAGIHGQHVKATQLDAIDRCGYICTPGHCVFLKCNMDWDVFRYTQQDVVWGNVMQLKD